MSTLVDKNGGTVSTTKWQNNEPNQNVFFNIKLGKGAWVQCSLFIS